jgi:hypothetical protein
MTKKEFTERCKEIMASTELAQEGKEKEIRHAASLLIDRTMGKSPEIRSLKKRWAAIEKKLAGHNGFSYCPESGNWYPRPPSAVKALEREWIKIHDMKIDEVYRKALTGKAA